MKDKLKTIWKFTEEVFDDWSSDKAPKLGAALSFYTMFSLAPLLLIVISTAGLLFGAEAARGEIISQIDGLIGTEGAEMVQTALQKVNSIESGLIALFVSLITLIIGSTAVFIELQDSFNMIWKVRPKPGRNFIKAFLVDRYQSFALVVGTGFLLLVSLLISAGLNTLSTFLGDTFVTIPIYILEWINNLLSLMIVFIMFCLMFKVLPDVHIKLKDVWIGALVTSLLFVIGKYLIGVYLGSNSLSSTYGAAGSLVVLLLWVYYSAQILFLGAEFTQVYTKRFGSGITPTSKFERYFLETGHIRKDPKEETKAS